MKYRFYQFLELAGSLIKWLLDQVDPLSEKATIESLNQCSTSVKIMHLERCLELEYRGEKIK